jgi:hypothetical protein
MVRASTSIRNRALLRLIRTCCEQRAFSHVAGIGATLSATAAFSPFISRLSRRLSRYLDHAYDVMHQCKDLKLEIALRTHFGAGCRPHRRAPLNKNGPKQYNALGAV